VKDESINISGPAVGPTNAASQPEAVDRATFQAELDRLRVREKAHTREGDAIAAARRRLPMVEVDPNLELIGPHGALTLLEAFEGRRQLIAYYFMWHPGQPAAKQCEGCTWVTTQVAELSYLHSRDITYAVFCQGPYEESIRYHDFMAWDMPWYSAQASLDALLVGRHIGMMHLVCYLRDGDRVFETYWTTRRGVEEMDYSYALMDLTVYGRQEPWEDSLPGGHNSGGSAPATSRGSTDAPSLSGRDSRLDALTTSPLGPDRYLNAATIQTSTGATSSAGSKLPTGTALICSSRSPTPSKRSPPVAVMDASCASGSALPTITPTSVREPCTTTMATTEAITPAPSAAAKAIEAKPSSAAFRMS
jgi:predicted dithiol-disulfide oxidoreductase (DUF899 family)